MASQVVGPPCHLLRLPYELLKPILADLSQQDQISTSKTCVTLWELTYPMAYNRITLEISPARRDSAWKHLASGVGLRYVRHLAITSLYEENEKPRGIEDLVAGTIIAALHCSQLLSFSLTVPVTTEMAITIKNVFILMETQLSLEKLNLPGISGSAQFLDRNHTHTDSKRFNLRDLTIHLSSSTRFDSYLSHLMQIKPDLGQFHLRFNPLVSDDRVPIPLYPRIGTTQEPGPFLMATRLTFLGSNMMKFLPRYNESLSVPNLRALALIDCKHEFLFWDRLDPRQTRFFTALMVKAEFLDTLRLNEFVKRIEHLRELVVYGSRVHFPDLSGIIYHMHNLKLLALVIPDYGISSSAMNDLSQAVSKVGNPPAFQHLSLSMGTVWMRNLIEVVTDDDRMKDFREFLDMTANFSDLKSLILRCEVCMSYRSEAITAQELKGFAYGAGLEPIIGRTLIDRLGITAGSSCPIALEFVSTTANCRFYPNDVSDDCYRHVSGVCESQKRIISLKSKTKPRLAIEAREEMIQRYAKDNYHFLEDYVDGMMKASRSEIVKSYVYDTEDD